MPVLGRKMEVLLLGRVGREEEAGWGSLDGCSFCESILSRSGLRVEFESLSSAFDFRLDVSSDFFFLFG